MPYYLISHPQLDITAAVEAPTSEKGRTTFLDYLERNHRIDRRQRQILRRGMATKRVSEEDASSSDLMLHYEYEHVPEVGGFQLEEPRVIDKPVEQGYEAPQDISMGTEPLERLPQGGSGRSPIQELAIRSVAGGSKVG